jgi:hypothetical protein
MKLTVLSLTDASFKEVKAFVEFKLAETDDLPENANVAEEDRKQDIYMCLHDFWATGRKDEILGKIPTFIIKPTFNLGAYDVVGYTAAHHAQILFGDNPKPRCICEIDEIFQSSVIAEEDGDEEDFGESVHEVLSDMFGNGTRPGGMNIRMIRIPRRRG